MRYADVGFAAFGKVGVIITNTAIVTQQLGFVLAYIAFISQTLHRVVPHFSKRQWIFLTSPVFTLGALLRDIGFLSSISSAGMYGDLCATSWMKLPTLYCEHYQATFHMSPRLRLCLCMALSTSAATPLMI